MYDKGEAISDSWTIPSLLLGLSGTASGLKKVVEYAPYLNDIWQGRDLLFHKPFNRMSNEEFKSYGKLGRQYYKDHLRNNPVDIKDYGLVEFGRTNMGKDKTTNMEQYPFLRKNLQNAVKTGTTNTKNEADRVYDHFQNTHKNNLYNYIIENITNEGKKYKMMKNKTLGE